MKNAPCEFSQKIYDKIYRENIVMYVYYIRPGADLPLVQKRHTSRAPDFGGPLNFGSKDNFQHFCKKLYLYFCFVSTHVFLLRR